MRTVLFSVCSDMLSSGSLLVHAAFLAGNNRGIVITGPSGSGKTTLATRVPASWAALSDELALISDQGDGTYGVQPLPTWSHYYRDPRSSRTFPVTTSVPLHALYFLEPSASDNISPISRSEAMGRLYKISEQMYYNHFHANAGKIKTLRALLFNTVCRVVSAVPVYILHATKEGDVWTCIEDSLDKASSFYDNDDRGVCH